MSIKFPETGIGRLESSLVTNIYLTHILLNRINLRISVIINTVPLHLHCEIEYQHHTHETCDGRNFRDIPGQTTKCSYALLEVKIPAFKLTLKTEQPRSGK